MVERRGDRVEELGAGLRAAGEVHDEREPAIPLRPRESIPCGETAIETARMCSSRPGVARSTTRAVASGVTSRGAKPVPPVVSTRSAAAEQPAQRLLDRVGSSGTVRRAARSNPAAAQPLREEIAAQVLAGAGSDAVGDRQDGGPHAASRRQSPLFPPDFSTSRMCSIEEFGSSPFVMS